MIELVPQFFQNVPTVPHQMVRRHNGAFLNVKRYVMFLTLLSELRRQRSQLT